MKVCDRCVHKQPVAVLQLKRSPLGTDHETTTGWELCEECATDVWQATNRAAEAKTHKHLTDMCPSLTPDQARQVELYIEWKAKQ